MNVLEVDETRPAKNIESYVFALSSFASIPSTASSKINILCRSEIVGGHFDDLPVLNASRVRRATVLLETGTSCCRNIL